MRKDIAISLKICVSKILKTKRKKFHNPKEKNAEENEKKR